MVTFKPVPVEPAAVSLGEFTAFCAKYGIAMGASLSNNGTIEKILARLSLAGAPSMDGYMRHLTEPTPADENAAAHAAVNEWNDKVGTARRLFLQFYHLHRGMTSMTDESAGAAARAVGLAGYERESVVTAENLVR